MLSKTEILCESLGLSNYTINDDGTVDVSGDVSLYDKGLYKIPLKFRKVTGNFTCAHNNLTTLKNCPNWVGGHFYCQSNKLKSLEGPEYIGGEFFIDKIKDESILKGLADVEEYTSTIHIIKDFNNLIKLVNRKNNISKLLNIDI